MNRTSILLPALLVAGVLPAQVATSPLGFETTEGNGSFLHFSSSSGAARRYQQIDNTVAGNTWLIQSLGWRRDGGTSGGGSNEPPRQMDMEIVLGAGNLSVVSSGFDANFAGGLRVQVFTPKLVNMPDWTGNAGTPAPFDFVLPFDTAFPYTGAYPLVIDFTYQNLIYTSGSATGGSNVDRDYEGYSQGSGTTVGTGCVASGQTLTFLHSGYLQNNGPTLPNYGMRLRLDGDRGPANAPALAYVDVVDANTTFPGLCTTVHALPLVSLPLGVSDASGDFAQVSYSFPYHPNIVGTVLYTQLVAFDPAQSPFPVVLSNSERSTMPSYSGSAGHEIAWQWSSLPVPVDNSVFWGGGLVLRLGI